MSVIILTTGAPGTGKSYSRVRWLLTDYLINNIGIYITNIPLNVDLIADHVSKKTGKDRQQYIDRLHVIPKKELDLWASISESTEIITYENEEIYKVESDISDIDASNFAPVKYLNQFDLSNAHVAIDEFHLYFAKTSSRKIKKLWNDFFAEIRKTGCTFEGISQDMGLFPREFIGKVGQRIDLLPYADTREPFTNIRMGDWYQLRAGFTGIDEQRICQTEYNKGTSFSGGVKWTKNHVEVFKICSDYYPFYNSYQRNDNATTGTVITPAQQYKKRIWIWFLRRNFFKIFWRLVIVSVFFWLCFFGGFQYVFTRFNTGLQGLASSNSPVQTRKKLKTNNTDVKNVSSARAIQTSNNINNIKTANLAYKDDLFADRVHDKDGFKPALFFDDFVWLRNGLKIFVNYKFKGGFYDGKIVKSISNEERFYTLSDDTNIYMF